MATEEQKKQYWEAAEHCLKAEAEAVLALIPSLDGEFEHAVELMYGCRGKVVVTGVGKSGHVGAKIAATLSSTGTPAFFTNPLDIYHGDLGVITRDDVVLAISNSGATDELLRFIPYLVKEHIPLIGMTSNPHSLLAQYSNCCLNLGVKEEASPLSFVPMASTTVTLALGDALACALMTYRDFQEKDFAKFHPGGSIGRALLSTASDVMRSDNLPTVERTLPMGETILTASEGRLGMAIIVDEENRVEGIITDGDIRRAMLRKKENFLTTPVSEVMTNSPICVSPDVKVSDIQSILQKNKIHAVLVVDEEHHLLGVADNFSCMI